MNATMRERNRYGKIDGLKPPKQKTKKNKKHKKTNDESSKKNGSETEEK